MSNRPYDEDDAKAWLTRPFAIEMYKRKRLKKTCVKCGKSLWGAYGPPGCGSNEGLEDAIVEGGYGSSTLGDMNIYRFSICEKCLWAFFKTCKIPPELADDPHDFTKKVRFKRFKTWKQLTAVWCGDHDKQNEIFRKKMAKKSKCSNPRAKVNMHGKSTINGTVCYYCKKPV